jgi:uncharacterized protein
VRVVDVDIPRKRIGLSMRQDAQRTNADASREGGKQAARGPVPKSAQRPPLRDKAPPQGALGAALAEALRRK